jgi:proline-specific peptidase
VGNLPLKISICDMNPVLLAFCLEPSHGEGIMKIRKISGLIILAVIAFALTGCTKKGLEPGEGYIDVDGGKVWYRIVGSGTATPLLTLHGGPGIPSAYLNPLEVLSDERPVIFYDQLGCGKSPAETDSTDWTLDNFVKRLGQVRAALGLDEVYLYGHSWGSMMAVEYLLTNPTGVKGVILAGPALNIKLWVADANELLGTLSEARQEIIKTNEEAGTFDAPEYQEAVQIFYEKYVACHLPWSEDLVTAFSTMNTELYTYVCGPSEFSITGTLKDYDITGRLGEINVPALVVAGEYDIVSVSSAEYYASLIPDAEVAIVPDAAHISVQDNIDEESQYLREFFSKIEQM